MIKKITKFKIWTAILFVIAVFFGFSAGTVKILALVGEATYNYIDHYNYDDILVYISADGPYGGSNATVGGELSADRELIYTLTITNPYWDKQTVNLKFELPAGFSYQGMVAGPDADQIIGFTGPGNLTWQNYEALAGESSISFKVKVP